MLKADRIGLVIVLASLSAIAAIGYLVFQNQHEDRLADIRVQGVSLVRALAAVPVDELEPGGRQQGVLQVLHRTAGDNGFAYLSVVDGDGKTINELSADGIIVPAATLPAEPSAWLGETREHGPAGRGDFIEFHAPLLQAGELLGFVRLGYSYPSFGFDVAQLPFFAAVALPVFLLVPLFYALLRLEIRPIRDASLEIGRVLEGESFRRLEVSASGELGDFMRRFNEFVELSRQRIHGLEQEQKQLITSTKVLTYRKNRVESVLETLPEAVLILDETGTVTFANQKTAVMFDVSRDVILTQPPQQWCEYPDVLQMLSKYQSGGTGRGFIDTIRFSLDTLNHQAVTTKAYPLFAPNDPTTVTGTLIVFRDETREALARQARADFVAHLSHELKSPLNVLGMYSESLLSAAGKDEAFRIEAANVIAEEVDRLGSLITGLLSMTQIENGSLTPDKSLVKLRQVAEAAFEEAKHLGGAARCSFELDAPKEMSPLYVDKDLLRIAITNLLSNAVKYNREGGEVRLTIEETDDAVQIRVADSGIGIADEDVSRIFEKFFRSEDDRVRAIGGHGLGLALTKQIVELHNGTLSLDRDRGEGTEFIINLWKEAATVKQAI